MILFIHRKDLRIGDMTAFDYIYKRQAPSIHVLILDPCLLKHGREREHSGINFLEHVKRLQELYTSCGQMLYIVYGDPAETMERLLLQLSIEEIVVHQDFTPYATVRDRKIKELAVKFGVRFTALIDHTLADFTGLQQYMGRTEPYKVFTPFYRKWNEYLHLFHRPSSPVTLRDLQTVSIDHERWNSHDNPINMREYKAADDPKERLVTFLDEQLVSYPSLRDHYAADGTSSLSKHLNVGAISIRSIYEATLLLDYAEAWRRQLAWRDFYLYQSVYNADYYGYEKKLDLSALSDRHFHSWHQAQTGIPIIDAAMTELNATGCMPNRLRMITAMFLTKNLQCPFTYGEQHFRYKLADYDNALNRGGWLWCSSLGFDAAPYFRIMNPVTQSQTHDPSGTYIRRWLPELAHLSDKEIHLPRPHAIVDLKASRAAAIEAYKSILR